MNRSLLDRLVSAVGAVLGVVLLAGAALLFYAHGYVHGQVSDQLKQQQIVFPAAGSKVHARRAVAPAPPSPAQRVEVA